MSFVTATDDRYGGTTPTPWNDQIPKQPCSDLAHAMLHTRYKGPSEVPVPDGFHRNRKRPAPEERTFKEPYNSPQTWSLWDASQEYYVARNVQKENRMPTLLESEKCELRAACGIGKCDPDAAAPRKFAVTVTIEDVRKCAPGTADGTLDALAYLANANAPADQHAAKDARFLILTGECALMYGRSHGKRIKHNMTIFLVYADERGELVTHAAALNADDKHRNNARLMFYELVRRLSELFEQSGMAEHRPASLGPSLDATVELAENAWVKALKWANEVFWNQLIVCVPLPDPGYKLDASMGEKMKHLKIYEKRFLHAQNGLVHPGLCWGVLACKEGRHEAALDFVEHELQNERARRQANGTPTAIIGLPYPDVTNPSHVDMGLHVLEMNSALTPFAGRVSCFNMSGPLGEPVTTFPKASAPRLIYRLQALHPKNYADRVDAFLPVEQHKVLAGQDEYTCTQLLALDLGFAQYSDIFGRGTPSQPPSPLGLKRFKHKPSNEDKLLSLMGGVPLGGAYRVGDVLSRLDEAGATMASLRAFLTSATARLGPHVPLSEVYADYAKIEKATSDEAAQLKRKLEERQYALDRAIAAPPIQSTDWTVVLQGILLGMWRTKSAAYPMGALPLAKSGLTSIAYAVVLANGHDLAAAKRACCVAPHWPTQECYRTAIWKVGNVLYPDRPLCMVVLNDTGEAKVAEFWRADESEWQRISSEAAIALSLQPSAYFVLYRMAKSQIVGLPLRAEPRPQL